MKKILIYISALLPVVFTVSLLTSAALVFPLSLIPNGLMLFSPNRIVEFIVSLLFILYGKRLKKSGVPKKYLTVYWLFLIVSILFILSFKNSFIVLMPTAVLIIYSVMFDSVLKSVKEFFSKCKNFLAYLNIFDFVFVVSLFLIQNQETLVNKMLNSFANFLEVFGVSSSNQETIVITLLLLVLIIIIPMMRTQLLRVYLKQNNIQIDPNKTLFTPYFMMFLISVLQIILYFTNYLQYLELTSSSLYNTIFVYVAFIAISVVFVGHVCSMADQGGELKENELVKWLLSILFIIALSLLDQIESDLIGILTWFLPVLLPTFIGEINTQKELEPEAYLPDATVKMRKHVYWLQLVSFNTLVILNIISSLNTVQRVENNEIIEVNRLKILIADTINDINSQNSSIFFSRFVASSIIVAFSVLISIFISKGIIWLLKRYYLNPTKDYFTSSQ